MNDTDIINEVRRKSDIVSIIGERIPLTKRGKNYFCVCPFHDDTNPSMSVSSEKQIYTCFSCHATGNVFNFLMDYEHISFREALSYLAERTGVMLKATNFKEKEDVHKPWYDAYVLASKYYQNNLNTALGKDAREYLLSRQITDEVIKEFEIGLSLNDQNALCNFLLKKGYNYNTLEEIGLASDNHDIYLNRITFPLYDINGRVVGFSGRIYQKNGQNKYLNTKETPIFKKGNTMYHYHIAKTEARVSKQVIVMEGFMDVIRASTIGIKNTVALMGTALTKEHISLLKRLSNNIVLCFDGDDAGRHATLSIGEMLVKEGVEPKVVALTNDEDPDTYILNHGKTSFQSLIDTAIYYSDYKLEAMKSLVNFKSDEEKAGYLNRVLQELSKIDDTIRIEITLKKLANEFDIGYNTLEKRFTECKENKEVKTPIAFIPKASSKKKDKYEKAIDAIVYYMVSEEEAISLYEREALVIPIKELRLLADEIVYYYKQHGSVTLADLFTYFQNKPEFFKLLQEIFQEDLKGDYSLAILKEYFDVVREYSRSLEINRLTKEMEKIKDPLEQAKIADQIRSLRIGAK